MNNKQNKISFIDRLLQGAAVEWKPLGEVADIYGGLTGKTKKDFENGNALFISYKNIFDNYEINTEGLNKVKVLEKEKQYRVVYGDILFTGSSETAEEVAYSSAVTTHFKEAVYLNSFSFGVRFHKDIEIIPEFSKYLFRCKNMRKQLTKTASGVTRFNVSKARFKKILIPIPPLHIQQEIVRILDKFTTMEAELDCRKRQYEYYRNNLLSFNKLNGGGQKVNNVKWMKLGEVAEIKRGKSLSKMDKNLGDIPIILYGELYTTYGNYITSIASYTSEERALTAPTAIKNDILLPISSTTKEAKIGKASVINVDYPIYIGGDTLILSHRQNAGFLGHLLNSQWFEKRKMKCVSGTTIMHLSPTKFSKILIPIPPLPVQQEIVSILDKFSTLTNSINEGLPKEIELRRKQYEYYRNELLSFPKNNVKANI